MVIYCVYKFKFILFPDADEEPKKLSHRQMQRAARRLKKKQEKKAKWKENKQLRKEAKLKEKEDSKIRASLNIVEGMCNENNI